MENSVLASRGRIFSLSFSRGGEETLFEHRLCINKKNQGFCKALNCSYLSKQ